MLQEQIKDKESAAYQRMSWEALKKSINGLINKVWPYYGYKYCGFHGDV